jgi:hypothetical protein
VGDNQGPVSYSYAAGNVSGASKVGGLMGVNTGIAFVSNSYATGNVDGTSNVGGLVGYFTAGTVNRCYAAGNVNGTTDVGGLVGYHVTGNYTGKSFWDNTVNSGLNGVGNIADPPAVIGESTVNMQTMSTFTDAGWDFVCETANGTTDIWTIPIWNGLLDYPRFTWQDMPTVDYVYPAGIDLGDFGIFSLAWLSEPGDANWNPDCYISGNDDDIIDLDDLNEFISNWMVGK